MHVIAHVQEEVAEDETMRNSRLPDARKDPNVWCIKVANGTEQSVRVLFRMYIHTRIRT
jgi:hypothetical protein